MMIHDQSTSTPMELAVLDAASPLAERTGDACTRIHSYQQQLRAELLAAASEDETRYSASWRFLSATFGWPGQAVAALQAVESRVRALVWADADDFQGEVTLGLAVAEA